MLQGKVRVLAEKGQGSGRKSKEKREGSPDKTRGEGSGMGTSDRTGGPDDHTCRSQSPFPRHPLFLRFKNVFFLVTKVTYILFKAGRSLWLHLLFSEVRNLKSGPYPGSPTKHHGGCSCGWGRGGLLADVPESNTNLRRRGSCRGKAVYAQR